MSNLPSTPAASRLRAMAAPLALLAIGLALLAMMVVTEGEPGLLPLVLVVAGAAWSAVAWRRARRR